MQHFIISAEDVHWQLTHLNTNKSEGADEIHPNPGGVEIFSNLPNLQERLQKQRLKLQAYLLNLCGL